MNKKRVDEWLLKAREALVSEGIASKDGKINKTFRSQISSFGVAVIMGSFKSAVAFFAEQGGASVEREKLLSAIHMVVFGKSATPREVLELVCSPGAEKYKDEFIDASIALKLAMNFFELCESKN